MAIEIVDFPINSMVDLSIVMLNYQRVMDIYVMGLGNLRSQQVLEVTETTGTDRFAIAIGLLTI